VINKKVQASARVLAMEVINSLPILDYATQFDLPFVWIGTRDFPKAGQLIEKWAAKPGTDLSWQWSFTQGGEPYLAFLRISDLERNSLQIMFSCRYHQPLLDTIFKTGELAFSNSLIRHVKDYDQVVSLEQTVIIAGVDHPAAADYWPLRKQMPDFSKDAADWL
jgi:hypothetical protein